MKNRTFKRISAFSLIIVTLLTLFCGCSKMPNPVIIVDGKEKCFLLTFKEAQEVAELIKGMPDAKKTVSEEYDSYTAYVNEENFTGIPSPNGVFLHLYEKNGAILSLNADCIFYNEDRVDKGEKVYTEATLVLYGEIFGNSDKGKFAKETNLYYKVIKDKEEGVGSILYCRKNTIDGVDVTNLEVSTYTGETVNIEGVLSEYNYYVSSCGRYIVNIMNSLFAVKGLDFII